jgi:hypothetical protein
MKSKINKRFNNQFKKIVIHIIIITILLIQIQIFFILDATDPPNYSKDSNIAVPDFLQSNIPDPISNSKSPLHTSEQHTSDEYYSRANHLTNEQGLFDVNTEYLIITPESFIDAIKPLADWKLQKGIPTKIVTIDGSSGINSTFAGPDLPARIHTFLREYYKETSSLKWLLLVGDSEIIPPRLLKINITPNTEGVEIVNYCDSDYYYSALETTWDNNSNQHYGEPGEEDWTPELYVGRLPVNTEDEVKTVVNKILIYEKTPPSGDWFTQTIQCGALMDRPNVIDNLDTAVDEGYNDYKDNAYKVIKKIWNILPSNFNNTTFLDYEKYLGGEYSKAEDTLNESNVLSTFNFGASTVNFVSKGDDNGVRHYNGNGLGPIEYASDYFFNYNTVKMASNGYRLPLVYTSSCTSVNFTNEDDTNLECLLTSPYGGGIGVIGATTETFRLEFFINNTSYGNWWLDLEFWQRFYNGTNNYRPGEILYELKKDYYTHFTGPDNPHPSGVYKSLFRTNFFSYNLLGDPEIPIYTDIPKKFKVEYSPIFSPLLRNSKIKIRALDKDTLKPVDDAKICLAGNGFYQTLVTDKDGIAEFGVDIRESSYYNFTITAHNYHYYTGTIEVHPDEDLVVNDQNITFDQNPVPPGAIVNISFTVKNNGSSTIPEFEVKCYYDKISETNLINTSILIQNLASGATREINLSWQVLPGSHEIIVVIDPEDKIFEFDELNNMVQTTLIENQPPIISSLPELVILEDSDANDIVDLMDYTWDPDTADKDLKFSVINISIPDIEVHIEKALLSITLPVNFHGYFSTVISAFDGTTNDTNILRINVKPVNDPPIINDTSEWQILSENVTVSPGKMGQIDKITVREDHIVDIMITGYDIDDDISNLTYHSNSSLFEINSTTGQLLFIPLNSAVGIHKINFSVSDGNIENNRSWRIVDFEVLNVNDPPVLHLPKSHITAEVGDEIVIKVIGYDIDLNDSVQISDNTDLFDINPTTGEVSFIPKYNHIGYHRIKIIAMDEHSEKTEKELVIEIESPPEKPLEPYFVVICPIILAILIVLVITQEYLKCKKKRNED